MEVTAAMLKSGLFADIGADEVPALLACLQCRKVDSLGRRHRHA